MVADDRACPARDALEQLPGRGLGAEVAVKVDGLDHLVLRVIAKLVLDQLVRHYLTLQGDCQRGRVVDAEQVSRLFQQFVARGVGMALASQFVKRVMQAGAQPMRVVRQQTHAARDLVRLAKSDEKDVLRQLIRIVLDNLLGMSAIFVEDALGDLGADADPLQVDKDIALAAFLRARALLRLRASDRFRRGTS